ncbi:oxaloacetate decarboxylase [Martelella mediterranea]|uniref:isocitrate lyase/PEP mutase family protein n=1 Tax=uncultured Martelella sp. TaxID=392331 RepID=UPI000D063799|nr:isocitrate lyase/phosphoenolpyruvate mutase family protein [uncultured Martelella sp.]
MVSQQVKYAAFKALHEADGAFVIPNPWDAGSARLLANLGFKALATTSAGLAFSIGKRNSAAALTRGEVLANASAIVAATDLPISADLENGFGASPEDCAETVRRAAETGLVGGSIEDASGDAEDPIYAFDAAVDRVRAAAEAAGKAPFLLTARCENFLWGRPDLADTIRRLQAFEEAGADVLYAPGLPNLQAIRTVCSSVSRPVNVVMGLQGPLFSVADLSHAGVKRISVGGSFARAALAGLKAAADEVMNAGTFSYSRAILGDGEATRLTATRDEPHTFD